MLKRFIFLQEDKVSEASTAALVAGLDISHIHMNVGVAFALTLCQSFKTHMSAQHMINDLCRFPLMMLAFSQIAGYLNFPWPLAQAFLIVPRPLRDYIYDYVARNRYKWFGRTGSCQVKLSPIYGPSSSAAAACNCQGSHS